MSITCARPGDYSKLVADSAPVDFLRLMRCFPTGVTVVTSVAESGRNRGMTCTSLASVTLRPSMLLVCLRDGSGTARAVLETGRFAVNMLHSGGQRAAEAFSAAGPERFDAIPWRPSPNTGQPWLYEDSLAMTECEIVNSIPVGDHAAVFGSVNFIEFAAASDTPLMYGFRQYESWPGRREMDLC
jgi:flavin reductase (NADH)